MDFYGIIEKKKRGEALSAEEIRYFVEGFTSGDIEDYKAASLLMAIAVNGMTVAETFELTAAMAESGEKADLSAVSGVLADKHSTGGVSDTTTLILAPVLAACGVKVAKMSGRGLGHTGGTIDKLESFPNLKTSLTMEELAEKVNEVGACIVGQTGELAPADRKFYALRDLTATVDSIPLIASSIMSKKLALNVPHLLLDVKYGSGAFMRRPEDALRLARCMVEIGRLAGRNVRAVVTRMNQPLGCTIGCNLEAAEAVEVLQGKEGDLAELARLLCAKLLIMTGTCETLSQAEELVRHVISDGSALQKLKQMIAAQGGDASYADDGTRLKPAEHSCVVAALKAGVITAIDAERLGRVVVGLGGGREHKEDEIDRRVGVRLLARVGTEIEEEGNLAVVYAASPEEAEAAKAEVLACFTVGESAEEIPYEPLVYAEVSEEGVVFDEKIAKILQVEDAVVEVEQNLDRAAEDFKYNSVVEKIEHTALSQTATPESIKKLCDEAKNYRFAAVCVLPMQVADAVKALGESSVKVCTVVGFPYGEDVTAVKVAAAKNAVKSGAAEVDMVMCVSKAKQGNWKYVTKEIQKVVAAAKKRVVKVIIETSLLTEDEIRKAVKAVVDGKAQYVKTSTGLFGGATMNAVKIVKEELTRLNPVQAVGIKASGGIKTKKDAFSMLYAGATRIGTSCGVAIAEEIKKEVEAAKEQIGKPSETV